MHEADRYGDETREHWAIDAPKSLENSIAYPWKFTHMSQTAMSTHMRYFEESVTTTKLTRRWCLSINVTLLLHLFDRTQCAPCLLYQKILNDP